MKYRTKRKEKDKEQWRADERNDAVGEMQWRPGPTLTFKELGRITKVKRSKAYRLMQKRNPDYDPTFPQGIPLFDSPRSPKFWWTHEALGWSKKREEKNRGKQGGRDE